MGGGGGKGNSGNSNLDPRIQEGMLSNETALVDIAQGQAKNAQQLYSLTEPGLQTAENFYQDIATGDPAAISRAIAPVAQQTASATAGAKANIEANSPAGGEKNLALEMTDVNRGAQIAKTASGTFLGAPNALGSLAGQGVGESISAAGTGISGLSAGSQTLSSLGGMQIQEQQVQMEQKGQALGAAGGMAGTGMELAGMFGL